MFGNSRITIPLLILIAVTLFTIFACFIAFGTKGLPYEDEQPLATTWWPTFKVYQLYYSEAAWPYLKKTAGNRFFRGMCVIPGVTRKPGWDVSAPKLMPILNDLKYQSLLCEYGAILAVANDAENWSIASNEGSHSLLPSRWVGFQSWRAEEKSADLKTAAIVNLEQQILKGSIPENAVLYWGVFDDYRFLFSSCVRLHGRNCPGVYSQTFRMLFGSREKITIGNRSITSKNQLEVFDGFLPDIPPVRPGLCYFSYFAMNWKSLREYSEFARAFFVALESLYNVHDDPNHCPIETPGYPKKLCWCFIMERLVNIWMYHTGRPIFLVNRFNGTLSTPLLSPQRRNSSRLFKKGSISDMLKGFRRRLSGQSLLLYKKLQGR